MAKNKLEVAALVAIISIITIPVSTEQSYKNKIFELTNMDRFVEEIMENAITLDFIEINASMSMLDIVFKWLQEQCNGKCYVKAGTCDPRDYYCDKTLNNYASCSNLCSRHSGKFEDPQKSCNKYCEMLLLWKQLEKVLADKRNEYSSTTTTSLLSTDHSYDWRTTAIVSIAANIILILIVIAFIIHCCCKMVNIADIFKRNIRGSQENVAIPQGNVAIPQGNVGAPKAIVVVPQANDVVPQPNVVAPLPNVGLPQANNTGTNELDPFLQPQDGDFSGTAEHNGRDRGDACRIAHPVDDESISCSQQHGAVGGEENTIPKLFAEQQYNPDTHMQTNTSREGNNMRPTEDNEQPPYNLLIHQTAQYGPRNKQGNIPTSPGMTANISGISGDPENACLYQDNYHDSGLGTGPEQTLKDLKNARLNAEGKQLHIKTNI